MYTREFIEKSRNVCFKYIKLAYGGITLNKQDKPLQDEMATFLESLQVNITLLVNIDNDLTDEQRLKVVEFAKKGKVELWYYLLDLRDYIYKREREEFENLIIEDIDKHLAQLSEQAKECLSLFKI